MLSRLLDVPVPNVVVDVMLADKWYGKGKIDNRVNGCDEVVYHGADGVFTLTKGKKSRYNLCDRCKISGDKVIDIDIKQMTLFMRQAVDQHILRVNYMLNKYFLWVMIYIQTIIR